MTKRIYFMLFLAVTGWAGISAQMRIGGSGTPNHSAVLDLNPDDNTLSGNATLGLALPRVNLRNSLDAFPLISHVKGMTVYNTMAAGDVVPGVYVNNGTKWIRQADSDTFASFTEKDGVTGNEVLDATDGSLVRSGAGTAESPYTLAVSEGGIETKHFKNGAVTGDKIQNGAVTTEKIEEDVWTEISGIVHSQMRGNTVAEATAGGGLIRSGEGSASSPFTLGLLPANPNAIMRSNENRQWEVWQPGRKAVEHSVKKPAGITHISLSPEHQIFTAGLYWCNVQLFFPIPIETSSIPYDFRWQYSITHIQGEAPASESGTTSIYFSFPVFLEENMNTSPVLSMRGLPHEMTNISLTLYRIL